MSVHPADRRRSDRRRVDRRRAPPSHWDSWFHALGVTPSAAGQESTFGPTLGPALSGQALPWTLGAGHSRDGALARVLRTYAAARAAIAIGLVAVQVALALLGSRSPVLVVLVCLAYAVQAITLWLLPRYEALATPQPRRAERRRQWLVTIGVDLLAFSALHALSAGTTFNYAALLVLPALMAGVVSQRLVALGAVAAVTLMLLVVAWRDSLGGETTGSMLQSGLAGLGLFVITLLAGELAARLAREELAARGSLELARQQALLNRLVIEEMADGVLVVDRRQRVRAANPAARSLLVSVGLGPPAPFTLLDQAAWKGLAQAVDRALAAGDWPEEGNDISLAFDGGHARTLRVRMRFTRGPEATADGPAGDPLVVLLLEDVRTAQARTRQEKLAAMGRVSAGIAHEIRNPLAAISQANALLQEDSLPPAQQRLSRIVADNVERLKRLVDDVMEVAPGSSPEPRWIDVTASVANAAAEWSATMGLPLGTESRLRVELPREALGALFDHEHLRRVLVNLLDNAWRHASERPGAIALRLAARDEHGVQLVVGSDSEPIPPEVERHLFEPFFSTRSRGSGLGLYICRELCERYGARIEYRARPPSDRWRNEFVVSMRRGALTAGDTTLPLDP